jgi:hypothetical protein
VPEPLTRYSSPMATTPTEFAVLDALQRLDARPPSEVFNPAAPASPTGVFWLKEISDESGLEQFTVVPPALGVLVSAGEVEKLAFPIDLAVVEYGYALTDKGRRALGLLPHEPSGPRGRLSPLAV